MKIFSEQFPAKSILSNDEKWNYSDSFSVYLNEKLLNLSIETLAFKFLNGFPVG